MSIFRNFDPGFRIIDPVMSKNSIHIPGAVDQLIPVIVGCERSSQRISDFADLHLNVVGRPVRDVAFNKA
jgi:hypothetical protein